MRWIHQIFNSLGIILPGHTQYCTRCKCTTTGGALSICDLPH